MKKFKKSIGIAIIIVIILVSIPVRLLVCVAGYTLSAPTLTEETAEQYILKLIEPQVEEIRELYDIPDLKVNLEFTEFEYHPPILYEDGVFMRPGILKCKFIDYYQSETFDELEQENPDWGSLFLDYERIPAINYIGIDDMRYSLNIERDYDKGSSKHQFLTNEGNVYEFFDLSSEWIEKNGETIYRKTYKVNNYSNDSDVCYVCNGTGVVKYYYGESDLEALIDGHEASWYGQCGSCRGTGKAK